MIILSEQIKFMKKAYAKAQRQVYPAHEHLRICMPLAFIGGFLEAYTYLLKGNIFANAQTGNFALMAINFAYYRSPLKAAYYLIPICAYIVGIFLTTSLPSKLNGRRGKLSWYMMFIIIQFAALLVVGFIPAPVPHSVTTVTVAFLCAMQYNTFKACRGLAMSTVFCTNNLRQLALSVADKAHGGIKGLVRRGIVYLFNILCFVTGAAVSSVLIRVLASRGMGSEHSIWLCCIILIPVGIYLFVNERKENC